MDGAALRPDLDPLPVRDVRAPAAEPVRRDQAVLGDVRDGEADHVEVRDEGDQRAVRPAARDDVADRVGLDLGDVADRLAHDVERELLVPGRPVCPDERFEESGSPCPQSTGALRLPALPSLCQIIRPAPLALALERGGSLRPA